MASHKDRAAVLEAALAQVREFGVAVDVGAHIGRWSKILAQKFGHVVAFEPMKENQDGWNKRMAGVVNAMLVPAALGEFDGRCRMDGKNHWKCHYAVPDDHGAVDIFTIDSIGLEKLDLLKIDCEGGDTAVLKGAVETLKRCRPVVIVESIPRYEARYGLPERAPITFLEGLGYTLIETFWVDNILIHPRD